MKPDRLSDEWPPANGEASSPPSVPAVKAVRIIDTPAAIAFLLLLIIFLGFALRLTGLEHQSMWSDEGLSYYRALQSPAEIFRGLIIIDGVETRDTNPALYFLLLHYWRDLLGEAVFSLRYSGVLTGMLAVPLMFVLGTFLFGRWPGFVAAFMMAISPFHIWQSQVLRNYSLLLTLNLLSVYGLFRYVLADRNQQKGRWFILWLVAGIAGIYTHYFGFFIFTFGLLILLFSIIRQWDFGQIIKRRRFWLLLLVGLMILLPAAVLGLDRFGAGQQFDFHHIALTKVLIHAAGAFGVGVEPTLFHVWWRMIPALILFLAGIMLAWRPARQATLILLGYQLIPLGLMLLLSIINPLYNGVRHLLIGLPPFLLFAANGATGLLGKNGASLSKNRLWWQLTSWFLLLVFILLVVIQSLWLHRQYSDEELLRDDIRGAAAYLNQVAEADDLIILHDSIIGFTFDYYYDGAAPWQAIPSFGQQDVNAATSALADAAAQGRRVWFLARPTPRTGFPRMALWEWAEAHWPRFFNRDFPSMWLRVQLVGFIPEPTVDNLPVKAVSAEERFGTEIQLHGVDLPQQVKAGEPWWSTFYWSKLEPDAGDYTLSLRFLDSEGQLWAQDDELIFQDFPAIQWPSGRMVGDEQEFVLASGMPPGEYGVWLRVLDTDGQPLATSAGQADLYLGDIEVQGGTDISAMASFSRQREKFGEVEFLGYRLPESDIKPGHLLPIDLFWRVLQTPSEDYQLRIQLVNAAGETVAEADAAPSRSDYPPSAWQRDELLRSQAQVGMPGAVEIEPHAIRIALVSPTTGEEIGATTLNETVSPDPWPYVTELPPVLEPLNVSFGDPAAITLEGFDLATPSIVPGDALKLTLFWRANADVNEVYHVFVHIIDNEQMIAAQVDGAPVNGFRPTLSWRKGELISDEYEVEIGSGMAPGTYQLWVGLYQPETFERPLTMANGEPLPDNRVPIGTFTIEME